MTNQHKNKMIQKTNQKHITNYVDSILNKPIIIFESTYMSICTTKKFMLIRNTERMYFYSYNTIYSGIYNNLFGILELEILKNDKILCQN